jgi:hypothetical protein
MVRRTEPARKRRGRHASRAAAFAAALVLSVLGGAAVGTPAWAEASDASSSASIEGVWSFNGGQIAVKAVTGGTFEGTVVAETKFAECTHPVGQTIWSEMRLQPDGSYDGFHQWYFESPSCPLNPTLGPTAWRVLQAAGGAHFLRACLSSPGGSQPAIAADGTVSGATFGCVDSARVAPLPATGTLSLRQVASLPGSKKCLSRRAFKIHVRNPVHDPFRTISITIGGHTIATQRQGRFSVATVNLRGVPRGAFTVRIRATTVLGRKLSGHRTYHTCVQKRRIVVKRHRTKR